MASGNPTTQALLNSMRVTNQVQRVGVVNPPNMANVPASLLQAASPQNFNLPVNTRVDKTLSDTNEAQCRSYEGIGGLRRLARETAGRSMLDTGCGWIYKPSAGINPEISIASLGNSQGPLVRTLQAGERWFWDIQKAEKDISVAQCQKASRCSELSLLGRHSEFCGYCKTTDSMIPVENGSARFPRDANLMCAASNIVTASRGSCDTAGFQDMTRGFGGSRYEGFTARATLSDLANCTSPLTRDCVINSARAAGCADAGTLITALQAAPSGGDYDTVLRQKPSYLAYNQTANPGLTQAMLKDGSTALTTAIDDFGNLMRNIQSSNAKLAQASRDLCLLSGDYDPYNFCAEMMNPNMQITQTNFPCVVREWGIQGGTEKGTEYPALSNWQGRTVRSFLDFVSTIKQDLQSTNKRTNADAITKFIGLPSYAEGGAILPKSDQLRGAETVWILADSLSDWFPAIITRYDQRMATNGEVVPSFPDVQTLMSKWNTQNYNIALISAFEYRPTNTQQVQFQVTTDDGFMIGINQNPFENTAYRSADWGSWRNQGATRYTSGQYTMWGDADNQKNVVVMKWFSGGGPCVFDWRMMVTEGTTRKTINPAGSFADRMDFYLTQEPSAPWLQYEVCSRPNLGAGSQTGFFEKRWNGQVSLLNGNVPIYSFDNQSANLIYQTDLQRRQDVPGKKPYTSFVSNSSWITTSRFSFTCFKTLTLLIRPVANLANQAEVSVFGHGLFGTRSGQMIRFGWSIRLKNNNGQYTYNFGTGGMWEQVPAFVNEWNLLVIQYVNNDSGLRFINISAEKLSSLQTDDQLSRFFDGLRAKQSTYAQRYLVGSAFADHNSSGHINLGGSGSGPVYTNIPPIQSFTGDIAWMHGFNYHFNSIELLQAELNQTWLSRWPRGTE
jgi:hypothetical protein